MTASAQRLPRTVWRLAAGFTLSTTAENFVLFALLWLAEPQGWSGTVTGLLVVVLRLPALLGGILGGRLIDRFGPVRLAVVDTGTRAAMLAGLAWAGIVADFPLPVVLTLGAITGGLTPISYAAVRTCVPRLVPPASRARANTVVAIGDQLPLLLGPAAAGFVLAVVEPGPAFLVPAILLVLAALLLRVRMPAARPGGAAADQPERAGHAGPDGTWRPGHRTAVSALVGLSVAYYFCYGPFEPAIPQYTRHVLGGGEQVYGLLWAAFGLGALLGLALAPWLARYRPGWVNAIGAAVWGLLTLPLAFVHDTALALAVFGLSGLVWGPYTSIEATALQSVVPRHRLGLVFGTQRAFLVTAFPLGAAVGGFLLDHFTATTVMAASALGCTAAGLAALCTASVRAVPQIIPPEHNPGMKDASVDPVRRPAPKPRETPTGWQASSGP